ncbi:hypothetical protein LguiB_007445 [Lonicera macranthoides]
MASIVLTKVLLAPEMLNCLIRGPLERTSDSLKTSKLVRGDDTMSYKCQRTDKRIWRKKEEHLVFKR